MMQNKRLRNVFITLIVIIWVTVFHYESLRYSYLSPLLGRDLPKVKFLFPPVGWIMFYRVDNSSGYVDVLGVKDKNIQLIDPHEIFRTRTIGFDNVHRNILSTVAAPYYAQPFCRYLGYRFSYFDDYVVMVNYYPDLIKTPLKKLSQVKYRCSQIL